MGWVSVASDDFNRADENPLGNGVWTVGSGETTMALVSNQAKASSDGSDCASTYTGRQWSANHGSRAKLTCGSDSEQGPCLALRYSDSARTCYRVAVVDPGNNTSTTITIRRFVAGASASIHTFDFGAWTSGTDVWEARVSGPANNALIEVLRNGTAVTSFTDTAGTVPAGGRPGVSYSSTDTGARLDDWEGLELITPPTPDYSLFPKYKLRR